MSRRVHDSIGAVRALYQAATTGDLAAWTRASLDALVPLLDRGGGIIAYHYDLRGTPDRWRAEGHVAHGVAEDMIARSRDAFHLAPSELTRACHHFGPVALFSEQVGVPVAEAPESNLREVSRRDVIVDVLGVNASNPDGTGVMYSVPCPDPVSLTVARRRWLAHLSAHAAAARRLVDAFSRGAEPAAVLNADGSLAHAEAATATHRERLREWVRRAEEARGAGADRSDQTLVAWEALVAGRYSMVDRLESDGRRYIVAYANEPDVSDPRGLTPHERALAGWVARGHPLKLVAYELGVELGTVTSALSRILSKLGLRSRTELVAALQPPTEHFSEGVDGELVVFASAPEGEVSWPSSLTQAERAVAAATLAGRTAGEIGRERKTTERTVTNQLASIYRKLGVTSRNELVCRFGVRSVPGGERD